MRSRWMLLAVVMVVVGARGGVRGDVTPMTAAVPEEKAVSITCAIPETDVEMLDQKMKLPAGEYHYLVWLPAGYHRYEKRAYPCLFVSMPGGNAKPDPYVERLKRDEWMMVCLTEARNGAWEPVAGNFLAAHDDAVKRFRIAEGFKFMTGASGGARSSGACTSLRPGFAGVFLQAAGFAVKEARVYDTKTLEVNPGLGIYGVFGIADPNRLEAEQMQKQMPKGTVQRFSLADGGHGLASAASIDDALDYLEDRVYVKRDFDAKAGAEQYAIRFGILVQRAKAGVGMAKFEAAEEAERIAEARKLSEVKGLAAEVGEMEKLVKTMPADPGVARELAARAAYREVRDGEDSGWVALGTKTAELSEFVKGEGAKYAEIGKKFAGTDYGKRAAERAVWMAKGAPEPVPLFPERRK